MKKIFLLMLSVFPLCTYACITCNNPLQNQLRASFNTATVLPVLSIIILLILIVLVIYRSMITIQKRKTGSEDKAHRISFLFISWMVLGIGLGGFIDGILLHQILQWHEMLSSKIPVHTVLGKSVNMFWDGLFHLLCLIAVIIGIILLQKSFLKPPEFHSSRMAWSGLLCGWGVFNIVEGLMDHHVFNLHNVREKAASINYPNTAFLVYSFVLLIFGALLFRSETKKMREQRTTAYNTATGKVGYR